MVGPTTGAAGWAGAHGHRRWFAVPIRTARRLLGVRAVAVIPTYNEADTIATIIRGIRAAAPTVGILVVDDNSPDGTADLLHEYFPMGMPEEWNSPHDFSYRNHLVQPRTLPPVGNVGGHDSASET